MTNKSAQKLDSITFEVLKNAFLSLVESMSEQVLQTCRSFVIYNRDFSHVLCDAEGNMISHGQIDLSGHIGTMHFTAKAIIREFEGDINPGDVFIMNDAYEGNTHWSDIRVLRPVFYDGKIIAYTQSSGHWADVGGNVPGSFDVGAKTHFSEGLRIPPVRIWKEGVFQEDVARLVLKNTRAPQDARGDLFAQAGATALGERELLRLIDKYGIETVLAAFDEVQDYSERYVRTKLATLPDGTWERVDYIDQDPGVPGDGLIPIRVKMVKKGDSIHFDLDGTHDAVHSAMNSGFGGTFSALAAGVKMFFPDIPMNAGFYRTITHNLPPNSLVDARWPTPCIGFMMTFEKILNQVLSIWSEIDPERAIACSFNLEYLLIGGFDHRAGAKQAFMLYDWMSGGWGGRKNADGGHYATLAGVSLHNQPVEGQERLSPALTTSYQFVQDSAGPGLHRGGLGMQKGIRIGETDNAVISYLCDRERAITWGDSGGLPANPIGVILERDGQEHRLGVAFANIDLQKGDHIVRSSSGGGGMGDPLLRNPEAVLEDVMDEYVSVERARKDYGVVIIADDPDVVEYHIDFDATAAERKKIQAERKQLLSSEAEEVASRYRNGELDALDAVRQYGVILKWDSGELLPNTTDTYRELMASRTVSYWD